MELAQGVLKQLRALGLGRVMFERTGNIGKSYRRHDEIGTPMCVTVDFETMGEEKPELAGTVTVRDRDTMEQKRMPVEELLQYVTDMCRN